MESKAIQDIQTEEGKKDIRQIASLIAGKDIKHFGIVKDGAGKVYVKTNRTYKKLNNDERHPLEKRLREITKYYYRNGKVKTLFKISKGEFE